MPNTALRPINPLKYPNFIVDAPELIQHKLELLINRHELVALYPALDSTVFGLSSLLEISGNTIWLDIPADKFITARLLQQGGGIVVAHSGNIHTQFEFLAAEMATQDGKPAIRAGMPNQILHLQQRDAYRQRVPLREPVQCQIPVSNADDVMLAVIDLSVGGVGLLGFSPELKLEKGHILHNCKINLPGCGLVVADLQVKSVQPHQLQQGITTLRTGCNFLALPAGAQTIIMSYVNRIERQRLQQHYQTP